MLLQWHVTERCNLRCAHCYQEGLSQELPFEALLKILEQYREMLTRWRSSGRRVWGHVTVTGGEPFVRSDFFDLLEAMAACRREFSFAILTNGTLVNDGIASRLGQLSPSFVQVSIEGGESAHDSVRGKGSFQRAFEALRLLRSRGVPTLVAFTAHSANYREFPAVADLARKVGAKRVWADRLIPLGAGAGLATLSHTESRELFQTMAECRKLPWWRRSSTEVAMHRALQFLVGGGKPYRCTAGDSLLAVMPNGDLLPCRRLPVAVGNLMRDSLSDLYYESEFLGELRSPERIPEGCRACFYARLCGGGLRCLSYAVTGDPFQGDPGCWKLAPWLSMKTRGAPAT